LEPPWWFGPPSAGGLTTILTTVLGGPPQQIASDFTGTPPLAGRPYRVESGSRAARASRRDEHRAPPTDMRELLNRRRSRWFDEALGVGSRSGFPNAAGWSNFAGRKPLLGRPSMGAHPFRRWTMAVGRRDLDSNSSEAIAIRGTDDELGLG
jgi:hypothetical protein